MALLRHMVRTKQCTRCDKVFPLTEFGKHRLSPDGHAYQCKECGRKRSKLYRESPEGIYTNLKGQSKFFNKGDVGFTREEFVAWYSLQLKECVYCDIPEEVMCSVGDIWNNHRRRLDIDRIDGGQEYKKGNIVLACPRCNMTKSDTFSFAEMREIAQKYIKPKWKAKLASKVREE